jgi:peptidylprolyl isomerase
MRKIILLLIGLAILFAKNQIAVLETTSGKIEIELRADIAPLAVKNFTTHIKNGFYNKVIFHRVIKNFMIQSGDPLGTGMGGKSIWNKSFKDEFSPNVTFDKVGILAMANRGPNTNGSQFFITTAKTPWLNGKHTIFGYVTNDTYKNVQKIENSKIARGNKPIKTQRIIKAYIK